MKQVKDETTSEVGICPNCKHDIQNHSNKDLAECTIAFLKSIVHSARSLLL